MENGKLKHVRGKMKHIRGEQKHVREEAKHIRGKLKHVRSKPKHVREGFIQKKVENFLNMGVGRSGQTFLIFSTFQSR